ncbi:MAG: DUF5107 domain-containing protein [Verrucomicrobia bacterium]|nr:DUF5107 domain-containing protein [Verrucomicrobiota bacterium]
MAAAVTLTRESVTLPTYLPAAPDRNPMFLESRVYQGSSGRVYPLRFYDRIAEQPVPYDWDAVYLENEFLRVMILPQLGGRIHRMLDKTNHYDAIYFQPVIKPALVGLAGPWASGGIEFNWPQHHRPSTFMPADVCVDSHPDGAITVWLGEHDPMARMKGMHGVCLHPGRAVVELKVRIYNRTDDVQTFLWWANAATRVHEHYQSFFPPDATLVADHAKRAMSTYPLCSGRYYGVEYAARARNGVPVAERPRQYQPSGGYPANDLSWYANIPVPTSYMAMDSREDFCGGYDHRAQAGLVHLANHHIAPGKKQWTWGNHEFGYAWDRNLTDADEHGEHRPYIELMAGVFTDNQPDFSFLQPGETRTWSHHWYPIQQIGPAQHANLHAAVSLAVTDHSARLGVAFTATQPAATVTLRRGQRILAHVCRDLSPAAPLVETVALPRGATLHQLCLEARAADGTVLIRHQPRPGASRKAADLATASEPPLPEAVGGADELFLIGLHLEQYRHATRPPEAYWQEALRRDDGDSRCHLALGRWHLRRGEFGPAESHLRASLARLTRRNPNPADGEAFYQLGRCLVLQAGGATTAETRQAKLSDAYAAFYKATWNHAWQAAGFHALAELDCRRLDWTAALDHLERALRVNTDNLRARNLRALALRRLGREAEAAETIRGTLALDPLDHWGRLLANQPFSGDTQVRLDLALDFARAGFFDEAERLLAAATPEPLSGTAPLVAYYRAWLSQLGGEKPDAIRAHLRAGARTPGDYCFPARLEEQAILRHALAVNPRDSRAHAALGHWLYDRRRHREAITHWKSAVRLAPRDAVVWRCLGLGYINILGKPAAARRAYAAARRAAPRDARLLYEADQLAKRLGISSALRRRELLRHPALVAARDDLSLELCALHNQLGQPALALPIISTRRFQPWEGGEGQALGQHTRTRLLLGRAALADGDAATARAEFSLALTAPEHLGEARHLLANQSEIHFWLGEACAASGDHPAARTHWHSAASFRGDFQAMSVRDFSELTYYTALAQRRLGQTARAERLLHSLLAHARRLAAAPATIDYFATSLPTMLLFSDDLPRRQRTTALFLEAQARFGLGERPVARRLLRQVLTRDPGHAPAADFPSAEH